MGKILPLLQVYLPNPGIQPGPSALQVDSLPTELSQKSCPTLYNQVPLSMVILQARILEWVAMPSSRRSSWLKDRTQVYLCLLHCRWILYPLSQSHLGSPSKLYWFLFSTFVPRWWQNVAFIWLLGMLEMIVYIAVTRIFHAVNNCKGYESGPLLPLTP